MAANANIQHLQISREEYIELFGESDFEDQVSLEKDSDVKVNGISSSESSEDSDKSDDEFEESEWTSNLSRITVDDFTSPTGTIHFPKNAKELAVFSVLIDEDIIQFIVRECNLYAHQKLANTDHLVNYKKITVAELKAYLGVRIIIGIISLPRVADYWSSDPFIGNQENFWENYKILMLKKQQQARKKQCQFWSPLQSVSFTGVPQWKNTSHQQLGPTFPMWWLRFKKTYNIRSALGVTAARYKDLVSFISSLAMQCWRAQIRAKQLSTAATS